MFPCTFSSLRFWIPTTEPLTPADLRPPFSEPERPARLLQLCRGLRQVFRNLNFFRRPQFRAAGPRIAIAFFFRCCHRLLGQYPEVLVLNTAFAEGILYDAVFQRVK